MTYPKSQETIGNIFSAARFLFVEKNYSSVSVANIAEQANVSTGALYHHFSSKEDIYLQMMHHYLGEIQASLKTATDNSTDSCRDRLDQFTIRFLQLSDNLRRVASLVRRDINIFADPMRTELIRAYQAVIPEPLEAMLCDGIAAGEIKPYDARLLSWEFAAMVEVAINPYSRNVLGGPEEIVHFVIDLFLQGSALPKDKET